MKHIGTGLLVLSLALLSGCSSGPSDSSWIRLFGSPTEESAHAVALAKDGSVYVVGSSLGTVDTTANRGGRDVFIAKYDTNGEVQWKRSLGTAENEEARAVAVDQEGNAFVTGYTGGALDGGNGPKDDQIFVAKFNSKGETTWLRLYGETNPININSTKESGEGIALAADGSIFVAGYTVNSFGKKVGQTVERDGFVLKMDGNGEVLKPSLLASPRNDAASAIAFSPLDGAVYVGGSTDGSLGEDDKNAAEGLSDAFIARLGLTEDDSWMHLVGTASIEVGNAIAVNPTTAEVYLGGNAAMGLSDSPALGMQDGFVAKFDRTGKLLWQHLVGGASFDSLEGLAVGSKGQLFATGATWNDLRSGATTGRTELYLAELKSADGNRVGALQRSGSEDQAWGKALAADGLGRLVAVGRAGGSLEGQRGAGGFDALVWKLKESELAPKQ